MMENNRIADCIAIALVLLALASAGAGTFGVAATPPQPDADQTAGRVTVDGAQFDFPIDNVTASARASLSAFAFPINNATLASGSVEITSDLSWARGTVLLALGQDMDPY